MTIFTHVLSCSVLIFSERLLIHHNIINIIQRITVSPFDGMLRWSWAFYTDFFKRGGGGTDMKIFL